MVAHIAIQLLGVYEIEALNDCPPFISCEKLFTRFFVKSCRACLFTLTLQELIGMYAEASQELFTKKTNGVQFHCVSWS